jgi:ADP-ribose pyrophosphatase YjhB (NUDIX family)
VNVLTPTPFQQEDGSGTAVFSNDFVTVNESVDGVPIVQVGTGTGAVALVCRGDKVLMIRENRYATGSVEWELPRGGTLEGEEPLAAAVRSAEGKSGVDVYPEDAVFLGTVAPDGEILSTEVFVYVLHVPRSTKIRASADEAKWVDKSELFESCLDGSVQDSFTCLAVLRARLKGLI